MPNPEMILTFEWDGKTVHKETKHFEGESCVKETAFIEKSLGGHDLKRKMKADANKQRKKRLNSGLKL